MARPPNPLKGEYWQVKSELMITGKFDNFFGSDNPGVFLTLQKYLNELNKTVLIPPSGG